VAFQWPADPIHSVIFTIGLRSVYFLDDLVGWTKTNKYAGRGKEKQTQAKNLVSDGLDLSRRKVIQYCTALIRGTVYLIYVFRGQFKQE